MTLKITGHILAWVITPPPPAAGGVGSGSIFVELEDQTTVGIPIATLADLAHLDNMLRNTNEATFDRATGQITMPGSFRTGVRFIGTFSAQG